MSSSLSTLIFNGILVILVILVLFANALKKDSMPPYRTWIQFVKKEISCNATDIFFARGPMKKVFVVHEEVKYEISTEDVMRLGFADNVSFVPSNVLATFQKGISFSRSACPTISWQLFGRRMQFIDSDAVYRTSVFNFPPYHNVSGQTVKSFYDENNANSSSWLFSYPHYTGFADRLLGITSSFLLALATGRKFRIANCDAVRGMNEVFDDASGIGWAEFDEFVWVIDALAEKKEEWRIFNQSVVDSGLYFAQASINFARMLTSERLYQSIYSNLSVSRVYVITNRGASTFFSFPHLTETFRLTDISSRYSFGNIINFLFRPRADIFINLGDIVSLIENKDIVKIAIQIRAGDTFGGSSLIRGHTHVNISLEEKVKYVEKFKEYFDCAKDIEASLALPSEKVKWILFSDSIYIRESAVTLFRNKVVSNLQILIEHSAKETVTCSSKSNCKVSRSGFKAAAAEWWLMGDADYFVISEHSGYGRTAAMRRGEENVNKIYTARRGNENRCHLKTGGTTYEQLVSTNSGL